MYSQGHATSGKLSLLEAFYRRSPFLRFIQGMSCGVHRHKILIYGLIKCGFFFWLICYTCIRWVLNPRPHLPPNTYKGRMPGELEFIGKTHNKVWGYFLYFLPFPVEELFFHCFFGGSVFFLDLKIWGEFFIFLLRMFEISNTNFWLYLQCCIIEACRDGLLWYNKVGNYVIFVHIKGIWKSVCNCLGHVVVCA